MLDILGLRLLLPLNEHHTGQAGEALRTDARAVPLTDAERVWRQDADQGQRVAPTPLMTRMVSCT